jgi:hypothetical protein
MNFEKAEIQIIKANVLIEVKKLIKEIELEYNSLDKIAQNILNFNYMGREILEYTDGNKNGNFWYNDAMIFKRKYFLFGAYITTFKWACSFYCDIYNRKTDIEKLNLKSIYNLKRYLIDYKRDLQKLKDNK